VTTKKKRKGFALGPGAVVSIIFHLVVIIYLLHYVRPSLFEAPKPKIVTSVSECSIRRPNIWITY